MEKIIIDIMGAGLSLFSILTLFGNIWVKLSIKNYIFITGVIINAIIGIVVAIFFLNSVFLPIIGFFLYFLLSLFYDSGFAYKLLLSLAFSAINFVSELLTAMVFMNMLSIPMENIQDNISIYAYGVLTSNFIVLFIVYIIKYFNEKNKNTPDKNFNILMAFMPLQSIIICYIVTEYSIQIDINYFSPLGLAAIFISVSLIIVTMVLLNKQKKALSFKNAFELSQLRLKMQIDHYKEMYQEQQRVKTIRHEMNNNLIAISGMLKSGKIDEVINQINGINNYLNDTMNIVESGFPPIDAIMSSKIVKAKAFGIRVNYKIIIDAELYIDQFDISVIVANTLDNAIEGINRSTGEIKQIILNILKMNDYISIYVENHASGLIYDNYQTSKPDKNDHGFGIPQINEIAKKYNGYISPVYDPEKKIFSMAIMLKNQKSN